jgi:transcription initiation factor TFIIIB Brf1 subunit/transcription initiation factor TFIIB
MPTPEEILPQEYIEGIAKRRNEIERVLQATRSPAFKVLKEEIERRVSVLTRELLNSEEGTRSARLKQGIQELQFLMELPLQLMEEMQRMNADLLQRQAQAKAVADEDGE